MHEQPYREKSSWSVDQSELTFDWLNNVHQKILSWTRSCSAHNDGIQKIHEVRGLSVDSEGGLVFKYLGVGMQHLGEKYSKPYLNCRHKYPGIYCQTTGTCRGKSRQQILKTMSLCNEERLIVLLRISDIHTYVTCRQSRCMCAGIAEVYVCGVMCMD